MTTHTDQLWYKDAIFYELHIRAFYDGNGDGVGDFVGARSKLDYLQDLGVTCIWLLPFYQSPLKDDGYDVSDYYQVHLAYGTLQDVRAFVEAAHTRDIRVIADLAIQQIAFIIIFDLLVKNDEQNDNKITFSSSRRDSCAERED